jgi:hypothetical protein
MRRGRFGQSSPQAGETEVPQSLAAILTRSSAELDSIEYEICDQTRVRRGRHVFQAFFSGFDINGERMKGSHSMRICSEKLTQILSLSGNKLKKRYKGLTSEERGLVKNGFTRGRTSGGRGAPCLTVPRRRASLREVARGPCREGTRCPRGAPCGKAC